MNKQKLKNLNILTEISLCVALSFVLSFFKFFRLPWGGEVSFTAIPILILASIRGWRAGITCGMIFGLVHFLQGGIFIHPLQFLLDYPLAYGALGLAGLFNNITFLNWVGNLMFLEVRILIGTTCRFLFHFASGIIFFKIFTPHTMDIIKYALIYNLSYMVPDLILSFIIIPPVIYKIQQRQKYKPEKCS